MRRFVECIAEEILLVPVARTGLRERIRVSAAADYSRSLGEQLLRIACQTVVSAERGKGRSFMRSSFEVRPTRIDIRLEIEGCFRDSEKRFGFRSLYVSSRGGFDLATAALYLLEIRSNSVRSLDRRSMA